MRELTLAALFLGGAAMTAQAQDKKDPPKVEKKERLDTTVTIKRWLPNEKQFLAKPIENVKAKRRDAKGSGVLWDISETLTGGVPAKGSEITDQDGKVYVVEKAAIGTTGPHVCTCKEKPAEKKPE